MKNRNIICLAAILAAALLPVGALLAADIVGSQTTVGSGAFVSVGESQVNAGPHTAGRAGFGVSGGQKVDFLGLLPYSAPQEDPAANLKRYKLNTAPATHGGLGNFDFVRVAQSDVWFGTWSDGAPGGNYQAYYVGDRTGTTLPASQTATYTVAGLNNSNVLTGTFNANFGTKKLTGALSGTGLVISIDANINSSDASFNGDAIANGVDGDTNGHFFGANAAALAGIAEFANTSLNTAFGGTKN